MENKAMEFNEKLQQLRKRRDLTQEELADQLYVSRTAVSKWESGRGYPNIDSLKAISKYFSVTIDELLSGDELLTLAEEDHKRKQASFRDLIYGLLDVSTVMFLFLPFFGQTFNGAIHSVSLLSLSSVSSYLRTAYFAVIIAMAAAGIAMLTLQAAPWRLWTQNKVKVSLLIHLAGVLLFIISSQPYPAVILLLFLTIKVLFLVKKP